MDFETVALPHLHDLFRAARRVLRSENEAEDIVQETMLQAWKSFDRFEPGTNCRAWLFAIMFHVIQHHRRKWFASEAARRVGFEVETSLAYEPPVPQYLTDEEVLTAFTRIPERFREVILLADVEGFSYKEVAEALGVPMGTVMSRLSRGRKLLRNELAKYAEFMGFPTSPDD